MPNLVDPSSTPRVHVPEPALAPAAEIEAKPELNSLQFPPSLFNRKFDWVNFLGIMSLHALAIGAFFVQFSWWAFGLAMFLWWLTGGLGICLCYHRLLTHRSFKTSKPVEYFLTVLGTLNWQGPPIKWVGGHRLHHKHSDTDQDPHSPHHGFTWSHVLWCFTQDPQGRPARDAAKDLQRDKGLAFIDRWHAVPQLILAGLLYAIGELTLNQGLSFVVWGIGVRTVIVYHVTWFVNSASHTWGYRRFETEDGSKNNWWVALLSFGEGWHNNHHGEQRSAAHGMKWYEIDPTWWTIWAMEKVGLAKDVVRPKTISQF